MQTGLFLQTNFLLSGIDLGAILSHLILRYAVMDVSQRLQMGSWVKHTLSMILEKSDDFVDNFLWFETAPLTFPDSLGVSALVNDKIEYVEHDGCREAR